MIKKDKEKKCKSSPVSEVLDSGEDLIETDPLGMWTGVPDNPYEKPVQDADDL